MSITGTPSSAIAEFMMKNGYFPSTPAGVALKEKGLWVNKNHFGILHHQITVGGHGCCCHRERRKFVGILWFGHPAKCSNGEWLIEVFGDQNKVEMRIFADYLELSFGPTVLVRTEDPATQSEMFSDEFPKPKQLKGPPPNPDEIPTEKPSPRRFSHEVEEAVGDT